MDGCSDGRSLCASQLQCGLRILLQERGLDGHLIREVGVDDSRNALEDMSQLQVTIFYFAHVNDAHRHHFNLLASDLDDAIAHDIRTRVDA